VKEHEFLAMMEVQRGIGQSLQHIAEGMARAVSHLNSLVQQGEQAAEDRVEVRLDPSRLPVLDGMVLGDPGPAATGWVSVYASDGEPIEPGVGSSFKLGENGLVLVAVTQEFYNQHEEMLQNG
jgi:hypothetical protein